MYFYEPSPLIAFPSALFPFPFAKSAIPNPTSLSALCLLLYEGGELHLLQDLKIKIFLLQVKATLCNNKTLIAGF